MRPPREHVQEPGELGELHIVSFHLDGVLVVWPVESSAVLER
ncbi:hypothetical protein [Streptomyces sp. NPDC055109]